MLLIGAGLLAAIAPTTHAIVGDLEDAADALTAEVNDPPGAPDQLDPTTLDAMVAALPKHSVPLTADVSDGFTFSGYTRSTKTGAINEVIESPFGPFTNNNHLTRHFLSWNAAVTDNYLNCDLSQPLRSRTDSVTNSVTLHYTIDATGTPGDITAANGVIPGVITDEVGTRRSTSRSAR